MTFESNDALKDLPALSRRYIQILDQTLTRYQLSSSLYYYLIKLHQFGPMPQERMVQLTGVNPSNVTRAVKQLIDLGYLTKHANPNDRRGFVLTLTDSGTEICPALLDCLALAQQQFLAPLAVDEQAQFKLLLQKMADAPKE
ncbi:MarR family winged helix-turn-helix transcriptional regulator [Lacticaseibacillus porcinae]|uniref:MarR family winged helix-turn-helix transcriptional regulator n=1 Tax=Lacticaseibacillus porcinae TaxID=1123687 RepID=UPI000F7B0FC7|nr:MarR family transcriptional regulator [Lacticaseibacillus porcinae]